MDRRLFWGVLAIGLLSACFGTHGAGSAPARGRAGSGAPKPDGVGGWRKCDAVVITSEIQTTNKDKVDLLFVIDNTESMGDEQAALAASFPRMMERLATGDGFPPARDIHVGVVSTDMGAIGANGFPDCQELGDDGIMLNAPSPSVAGCQAAYPRFLSFVAGRDSPQETAHNLECIASPGTGGCSLRQPLESALKALWPKVDPMAVNGKNRVTFLPDPMGFGQDGQGDGPNAGFLRNDPNMGLSVIAIVVVTNGDDCSSSDPRTLEPLAANDTTSVDLRCYATPVSLYMRDRYALGFRALRERNPDLVVFSVIAGVPPDMVAPEDYARIDWTKTDDRDAFYSKVLSDPRMVKTVDTTSQGTKLVPSCNTETGLAYPPRRLVEVAQGFGANGSIHSLCGGDLSSAIDGVTERIGSQLGTRCLPLHLARDAKGMVPCWLEWTLPPGPFLPGTPTSCDTPQYPFLRPSRSRAADHVCEVAQLPVVDEQTMPTFADGRAVIDGWYYDDFSPEVLEGCMVRIAFSPLAKPPTGVRVDLTCEAFDETPDPACH